MKPHKWSKEIKAWADGAEIEMLCRQHDGWRQVTDPTWFEGNEYRIKPQPKEPQYLYVYDNGFDKSFTTNRCGAVIKTDNPNSLYKYIGKIKLEDES